ncbi:YifB family Mg chelatase-like AAA ATPase [Bacillus sp. 03113]|uniref:YifB family Mg chelatase-like AAA ATPase n=1 Tax=Bacillus sp. 03113 TaxID=2578211 RepID=UPI001143EE44|nr:YifB family Mg chelatase-like AAA ATPase [Bacillus sp. 03113]
MTVIIESIGLKGMEGYKVNVEVQSIIGRDAIHIVGLPDASVRESKERITAAFYSLGYYMNGKKIIINLTPSEQRKNGPLFDLPIAIGILISMDVIQLKISEDVGFIGALSLDGSIQPFEGMLPIILSARKLGFKRLYLPFDRKLPHIEIDELELCYVTSIQEVIQHLSGQITLHLYSSLAEERSTPTEYIDFSQIIGHTEAKYALTVAAAGAHHLLMTGPPGCGKTMLAESMPSILAPLTRNEQLEMMSIYQIGGVDYRNGNQPSFRLPHHSASAISIIGGGQYPKPGEISLAHRGILFLDEIAEYSKKTLDMLRQPIENGYVTINRVNSSVTFPASFILIGAMNPCPCGYYGSQTHYCTCTKKQILMYQNKLSGPIRDRFDINLSLSSVKIKDSSFHDYGSSKAISMKVEDARKRQYDRYGMEVCNSRISIDILQKLSPLSKEQKQVLHHLSIKNNLSNRIQIKIIRLARTISDLEGQFAITDESIWKAIQLNNHEREKPKIKNVQ